MSDVSRVEYDAALKEIERLRTALLPFAVSCCTTRDGRGSRPETDTMTVEVEAGDWMRACVALGRMDVEYLRLLPAHARPTEAFLVALGLDEPPTEESWSSGTGGLNADWSGPPAEPPKAYDKRVQVEWLRHAAELLREVGTDDYVNPPTATVMQAAATSLDKMADHIDAEPPKAGT